MDRGAVSQINDTAAKGEKGKPRRHGGCKGSRNSATLTCRWSDLHGYDFRQQWGDWKFQSAGKQSEVWLASKTTIMGTMLHGSSLLLKTQKPRDK